MNIYVFSNWITSHWNKHAKRVAKTSLYQANELAGEAGELANVVKKICRRLDDEDAYDITPEEREKLIDECGDVLHCVLRLANNHGIGLDQMISRNVEKLTERYEGGKS